MNEIEKVLNKFLYSDEDIKDEFELFIIFSFFAYNISDKNIGILSSHLENFEDLIVDKYNINIEHIIYYINNLKNYKPKYFIINHKLIDAKNELLINHLKNGLKKKTIQKIKDICLLQEILC